MPAMSNLLLITQMFSALSTVILVLLQQSRGSDIGTAFGNCSSGSLFGVHGATSFLSRSTKWIAAVFFISTTGLAYISHKSNLGCIEEKSVMKNYTSYNSPMLEIPGTPTVLESDNPNVSVN